MFFTFRLIYCPLVEIASFKTLLDYLLSSDSSLETRPPSLALTV
jgi:hypothetical protein